MLTLEQEKRLEENKKLVYTTINTYIKNPGLYGLNDYDDLVQIGMMGLCKAVCSYTEGKAAFSSYAVPIIRNHLYNAIRDANENFDSVSSTSDEYIELNADLAYNNINSMSDDLVMKEGIDIITDCANKYGGIAAKGVEAIKLTLLGYSCKDIADMYDVDSKTITSWISRARQKLQKEPALLRLLDKN